MTDTTIAQPAPTDAAATALREVLAKAEYDLTLYQASLDHYEARAISARDERDRAQARVDQLRAALTTLDTTAGIEPEPEGAA